MGSGLPEAFLSKMERLLGDEFPSFLASYSDLRLYGLRVNTLKISTEAFLDLTAMRLEPVPWAPTGFYYREEERPGKHPHYHTGMYYIQEPSAMAPVELLDVRPGERVLDLCAAPGGKSTQIAAKLAGSGILVTNDIHPDRVKALVKNIELSGVRNAVVLNEQPEKLQRPFRSYFDKILIDAPCSGEGMFRKEEEMAKAWQPDWAERYAGMQRDLLRQAAEMLRPGGRIVYSTCTFSPEENEAMIAEFLALDPRFSVLPVAAEHGFDPGRSDWLGSGAACDMPDRQSLTGTVRLWPHHLRGEGHFAAALQHDGGAAGSTDEPPSEEGELRPGDAGKPAYEAAQAPKPAKRQRGAEGRSLAAKPKSGSAPVVDLQPLRLFIDELLPDLSVGKIVLHGEHAYASPEGLPDLSGIRVIRPGWYLGSIRKGRFEPSHALAMGLTRQDAARHISLSAEESASIRYLKGETLEIPQERIVGTGRDLSAKGYCLVCIDGYPAGWGKWLEGMLKNEYPAGWRWT